MQGFLFYDQRLPSEDPEGLARTVDEVLNQYGTDGARNELVALDEWSDWLHGAFEIETVRGRCELAVMR